MYCHTLVAFECAEREGERSSPDFFAAYFFAMHESMMDLGIVLDTCLIQSDSKSAVDMSLDPVAFKRTKHILRAAEFLRDLVACEVITCAHLPGKIMIADVLTKACSRPIFLELSRLIYEYSSKGVACPL